MPRIRPSLIRQARLLDPLLPRLLPICRDLRSAQNELRWLAEHARATGAINARDPGRLLRDHVSRRARGEPLQYVLGSEFFGDLEIKCRPGVLIPRQETAASVTYLAQRIHDLQLKHSEQRPFRVLDLCTGTGCIPLLFHHEFYAKPGNEHTPSDLIGIDISPQALQLASENQETQLRALESEAGHHKHTSLASLKLLHGDVLAQNVTTAGSTPSVVAAIQEALKAGNAPQIDVLISNPPYISSKAYRTTTAPSVRHFEPKLALVPTASSTTSDSDNEMPDGEIFYPSLLSLAERLCARVLMFEVADHGQAERVAKLAMELGEWDMIEIWRDDPIARNEHCEHQHKVVIGGREVQVLGQGHGRSVFAYRRLCQEV
ncbi:S-adenosyl-L-methionine-dependent methyltransferase [Teratosphaeria nubilosa]|uniref:S-adenosyl-L-methionine-dependent methyltransferase n=1 Tax=Teratosphaeria nubilosa TaxID=161662 RepID=A0A6G1LI22_9PEZI|nr:S-adenosyl-L-methionine-dependent methyltransferase [Teratosphaeria nubilosa]